MCDRYLKIDTTILLFQTNLFVSISAYVDLYATDLYAYIFLFITARVSIPGGSGRKPELRVLRKGQ